MEASSQATAGSVVPPVWFPPFLSRHRHDQVRLVLLSALTAAIPVVLSNILAAWIGFLEMPYGRLLPNWRLPSVDATLVMSLADVLCLGPLVETALTFVPLWFFRMCRVPEHLLPVLIGVLWGFLHWKSSGHVLGMLNAWPFYIFTSLLMLFEKPSLDRAWLIATATHAVSNGFTLTTSLMLASE